MADTVRDLLTAQFYDFELRGRGIHVAEFPIELEAPFHPFYGFQYPVAYIDDGRSDTVLSAIAGWFTAKPTLPEIMPYESPAFEPFAFGDIEPLAGCRISFPKTAKPSIELMEQLLVMLSGIHEPISFEIIADADFIAVQLVYRASYGSFIHAQLKAYFPDISMVPMADTDFAALLDPDRPLYTADFGLREECMRPSNTSHSATDTLTGFFGLCDHLLHRERVVLQVLFNGTVNQWADSLERSVSDGAKGSFFYDAPEMPALAKEKCSKVLCAVAVRVAAQADSLEVAHGLLQHIAYAIIKATSSPFNALAALPGGSYTLEQRFDDFMLRQSHRVGMLLNTRELATLVHFPSGTLSKKLHRSRHTTNAAPDVLINAPFVLGINDHHGVEHMVGIDDAQRFRHTHIIGATGTGKSTLLHHLIMQDVHNNEGCCVVDPHGDLIDAVIANIPQERIRDVVLIDPSDSEFPIGLNILSAHSDLERELLASDLVALFRRFSTSWGDQMNSVFANAICAFLYNTNIGTLGDLRRFFIEQQFRTTILATCTDPEITYYWQKEYPILKSSSIGSILTRLDSFLRPRAIRNMVCQHKGLDFQHLMDSQKIILVKLSHGLVGEENSHLLGAFIVSKLQQTAMARQAQAAHDRIGFHCYIDEFQHYVTPSLATMLSGTRKYALSLTLAHQNMQQVEAIDRSIAGSLLSNAGTRICFRVSEDAKKMQEGFSSFTADDLQNLALGEAIVRVNTPDQDFNIRVIPHKPQSNSFTADIIARSRNTYGVPIAQQSTSEPTAVREPEPIARPATPKLPTETEPKPEKQEREHLYLQALVKKLAQEHAYIAHAEVATPDGSGLIDVVLEKDGKAIAVEISVSTSASWELHNIEKCIAAGYKDIVVCVTAQSKIAQLQKLLTTLPLFAQSAVRIITPEQIPTLFARATPPKDNTTVYKGYRVKVQYDQSEGTNKNEIIQRILNNSKK